MSDKKVTLQRHIGLMALAFYGIGDILGSGIYGLIGKAAGEMGNAVWLAFLFSAVAAGMTGLSYASLGSRYPRAAGASYVVLRAFNKPFVSYVLGLAVLASGMTSIATASRAFGGYFTALVDISLPVAAVIFILAIAFVVFWGIRESMWLNIVCTSIEVSGLLLIIIFGAKFLGSVNYFDVSSVLPPAGSVDFTPPNLNFSLVLSGAVLTFYSFVGFEDIMNVSEEVKKPETTLPRGLLIAVGVSSIIYMLISLVAVSVVPAAELAQSKQPLVDVIARAAPWFPTQIYSVIAMFAVANTALLNFIMGSRLLYGMAEQKLLPSFLGYLSPKRRTPSIAIVVILFVLMILALTVDIAGLAKSTSVLLLMSFTLVNAALVVLKRRPKEPKGSFEIPTLIPILGSLVCMLMLSYAKRQEWMVAGIILAVIVVLYFIVRPSRDLISKLES